jgi:hypothetical protein
MKHDMARSDPHLLFVWKLINFIAYFVSELFQYTVVAQALKKSRSFKKFAQDMLQQLIDISWDVINRSSIVLKKKVQFRYQFGRPP